MKLIQAMLKASEEIVMSQLAFPASAVSIRPGNSGAPHGAYKGGMWFVGIYFGGMTNSPNQEQTAAERVLTMGIDVTRVLTQVPSKKRGDFVLDDGELMDKAIILFDTFLAGDSKITTPCNDKLTPFATGEAFYEDFNDGSMSSARGESPAWLLQEENPDNTTPIMVVSMSFSGMKYVKNL